MNWKEFRKIQQRERENWKKYFTRKKMKKFRYISIHQMRTKMGMVTDHNYLQDGNTMTERNGLFWHKDYK